MYSISYITARKILHRSVSYTGAAQERETHQSRQNVHSNLSSPIMYPHPHILSGNQHSLPHRSQPSQEERLQRIAADELQGGSGSASCTFRRKGQTSSVHLATSFPSPSPPHALETDMYSCFRVNLALRSLRPRPPLSIFDQESCPPPYQETKKTQ